MHNVDDQLFLEKVKWDFGGKVPALFDDHVRRSVPLYEQAHDLTLAVSKFFIRENSHCLDIGTSTGSLLFKLAKTAPKSAKFLGIDREESMISEAEIRRQKAGLNQIEFVCLEANQLELDTPLDFVTSLYTLQFMRLAERKKFVSYVASEIEDGGAFLLFEKVRFENSVHQDLMTQIYHDFKLSQGIKPDQILTKQRSLQGVLEPQTRAENLAMLQQAGFKKVEPVFQHLCFEGYLAIK